MIVDALGVERRLPRIVPGAGTNAVPGRWMFDLTTETPAMPAKSKAQQRAAGAALSAKRGETPIANLKGASKDMHDSMTSRELEDLAETPRAGLPDRKGA
jgi:hypothetical protein